jgi:hypothetical protein
MFAMVQTSTRVVERNAHILPLFAIPGTTASPHTMPCFLSLEANHNQWIQNQVSIAVCSLYCLCVSITEIDDQT